MEHWLSIMSDLDRANKGTDFLSLLSIGVEKSRANLKEYGKSLPVSLKSALESHFHERLKRSENRPIFGEYAPYFLGSVLQARPKTVNSVSKAWILMYEHTLLIDDLVDKVRKDRSNELILSNILLDSSMSEFQSILGRQELVWQAYRKYRFEWLTAMATEIDVKRNIDDASLDAILLLQGQKSAIVKFCATSLIFLEEQRLLSPIEEKGLDAACIAVQLLDDLADVAEDFDEGRTNILLTQITRWLRSQALVGDHNLQQYKHISLTIGIAYSGALVKLWKDAAVYWDAAVDAFPNANEQSIDFFRGIASECRRHSKLLAEEVEELPPITPMLFQNLMSHKDVCSEVLGNPIMSKIIKTISDRIFRGPKASQ